MMNRLLFGAIAATGLALLPACSDTFDPTSDCEGRILPTIGVDTSVAAPSAKANATSRATGQAMEISANDLALTLYANDGSMERKWASLTEFDTSENFPVGAYTFEVSYGDPKFGGFNKPYYFGSTQISVLENKTTPVNVTAKLSNAMITVRYSAAMEQYFTSYSGEVTAGTSSYVYAPNEMRTLYVVPGRVSLNINVTKPSGATGKLNAIDFQAEAAHHYIIDVTVNNGNVGGGALNVTFNSDVVEETVDLDISDQVLSAEAPIVSAIGFNPGQPIDVIEGSLPSEIIRMAITAEGIVETGILTCSPSLVARGWPETVDFANADEATKEFLSRNGMGMAGFDGIKGKMAFVGFTAIPQFLSYIDNGDNTLSFTLVGKDRNSKISTPLTLTFNILKMQMNIKNVQALQVDATSLNFDFECNGMIDNVIFERKNEQGIFRQAIGTVIKQDDSNPTLYHVTMPVPNNELPVEIRTNMNNSIYSEPYTVIRSGVAARISDKNVFATRATFSVRCGHLTEDHVGNSTVLISTDGKNFTEHSSKSTSGTNISITGLTPNTKYYVKVNAHEGESSVMEFTTESALQLPNPGMEDWADGSQYNEIIAGQSEDTPWGTANKMTTASGINTSYCKASGTLSSTDKYPDSKGSRAALIRTVGYGSGNTNAGALSVVNNAAEGLLHLGSNRTSKSETLTEGMNFTSRPTNITFFHKYIIKNSADYGEAVIWVKDASGNIIANGSAKLNSSSYTRTVIPLHYAENCEKAAQIYVRFVSSANPACITTSRDNITRGSTHVGSQLLIDDISLNY